jgi:superfamily II DNA helicase RecQ
MCALLAAEGIAACSYHAGLPAEVREASQRRFMAGEVDVVVATNAFGMGVDKADIRSVWHWALPTSVEAYYQEAGRAGRDGLPARAVLLAMRGDLGRLIQFIKSSELTVADVRAALGRLTGGAEPMLIDPREQGDRERIALAVAERAGTVSLAPASGGRMAVRFVAPLDEARAARLCRQAIDRRWDAYHAVKRFADTPDVCRRRQLLDHFGDDEPGRPAGRCCDVCDPSDWLTVVEHRPGRRAGQPAVSLPPVDEAQLSELKAWRLARAEGKPAYTVATNAVLAEVLARRPSSREQLLEIHGVGPTFVAKHGEDLLSTLTTI